jgi:hypothetical protein
LHQDHAANLVVKQAQQIKEQNKYESVLPFYHSLVKLSLFKDLIRKEKENRLHELKKPSTNGAGSRNLLETMNQDSKMHPVTA